MAEGRRLAAIMFTDLVGSTQLAQKDERVALALLREQESLALPLLEAHHGRLVKSTGDGMLVEFANARDAVECSVAFQRALYERNAGDGLPALRVRIGIHIGDVESKGEDILGDAVNIAARVEPLAPPGGVCLSGAVYEQTHNKVTFSMERLGPKALKGVSGPTEIYRVVLPWETTMGSTSTELDRTRVAVLPFTSMSPDPADEYFADGMTEELIDRLAQVTGLAVIARTSVMSYKKTAKKASEIAKELSVGTLVEGSVRKAGNQVRITAQLIHAGTEAHLWSNRYDRALDNIFEVQTEIAETVAAELHVRLLDSDKRMLEKKPTENTEAYGLFLRGRELFRQGSGPLVRQALGLYEKAIEHDPSFARAHVGVAECHQELSGGGEEPPEVSLPLVRAALKRALELDSDLPELHAALSVLRMNEDDGPAWEAEARRALELNPSLPEAHSMLQILAGLKGDVDEMVREAELAFRLDPLRQLYIADLGVAYFYTGREKEALEHWRRTEPLAPRATATIKTQYYLAKGDLERAAKSYAERVKLSNAAHDMWIPHLGALLAAQRGEKEKALLAIRELEQDPSLGVMRFNLIGSVYHALGDLDAYFDYMNRALEAHVLVVMDVLYSPLYAKARSDPRFQGLVGKLRRRSGFAKPTG